MPLPEIIRKLRRRSLAELVRVASTRVLQDNIYAAASRYIINEHDARWPTAPRSDDPDLASLHANGFVNLGNVGVDVAPLATAFCDLVDGHPQANPSLNKINIARPFLFHPSTIEFLRIKRVNDIVRGYLGDDATFDEVQLFRTPNCSRNVKAPSGQWHHDGVGHVLLVWVLLNDVDAQCRATWYAVGSHHRTLTNNQFAKSRVREEDIRDKYPRIVQLLGRKGDAILMDPHGFHRAAYEGGTKRDVFYLGFSSFAKGVALPWPGLNHGVGIVDEVFPQHFDAIGTLVRRERLFSNEGVLEYRGYGGRESLRANPSMAVLKH